MTCNMCNCRALNVIGWHSPHSGWHEVVVCEKHMEELCVKVEVAQMLPNIKVLSQTLS